MFVFVLMLCFSSLVESSKVDWDEILEIIKSPKDFIKQLDEINNFNKRRYHFLGLDEKVNIVEKTLVDVLRALLHTPNSEGELTAKGYIFGKSPRKKYKSKGNNKNVKKKEEFLQATTSTKTKYISPTNSHISSYFNTKTTSKSSADPSPRTITSKTTQKNDRSSTSHTTVSPKKSSTPYSKQVKFNDEHENDYELTKENQKDTAIEEYSGDKMNEYEKKIGHGDTTSPENKSKQRKKKQKNVDENEDENNEDDQKDGSKFEETNPTTIPSAKTSDRDKKKTKPTTLPKSPKEAKTTANKATNLRYSKVSSTKAQSNTASTSVTTTATSSTMKTKPSSTTHKESKNQSKIKQSDNFETTTKPTEKSTKSLPNGMTTKIKVSGKSRSTIASVNKKATTRAKSTSIGDSTPELNKTKTTLTPAKKKVRNRKKFITKHTTLKPTTVYSTTTKKTQRKPTEMLKSSPISKHSSGRSSSKPTLQSSSVTSVSAAKSSANLKSTTFTKTKLTPLPQYKTSPTTDLKVSTLSSKLSPTTVSQKTSRSVTVFKSTKRLTTMSKGNIISSPFPKDLMKERLLQPTISGRIPPVIPMQYNPLQQEIAGGMPLVPEIEYRPEPHMQSYPDELVTPLKAPPIQQIALKRPIVQPNYINRPLLQSFYPKGQNTRLNSVLKSKPLYRNVLSVRVGASF